MLGREPALAVVHVALVQVAVVLLLIGVFTFATLADALARLEELPARLPVPAVAGGGADGHTPQQGTIAEQMQQVFLPPEIKRVRHLLVLLFVQVVLVAVVLALALELRVGAGERLLCGGKLRLAFFGAGDAGDGVGMGVNDLVSVVLEAVGEAVWVGARWVVAGVLGRAVAVQRLPQRRYVPRLLETFNRGQAADREANMPGGEAAEDQPDDAAEDGEEDDVHREQGVHVVCVIEDLAPDPERGDGKVHPAEDGGVDEEEEEGFVVVEPDAGRQPWTMMVHFQHTSLACGAVVCAVRFGDLTLLAKS